MDTSSAPDSERRRGTGTREPRTLAGRSRFLRVGSLGRQYRPVPAPVARSRAPRWASLSRASAASAAFTRSTTSWLCSTGRSDASRNRVADSAAAAWRPARKDVSAWRKSTAAGVSTPVHRIECQHQIEHGRSRLRTRPPGFPDPPARDSGPYRKAAGRRLRILQESPRASPPRPSWPTHLRFRSSKTQLDSSIGERRAGLPLGALHRIARDATSRLPVWG